MPHRPDPMDRYFSGEETGAAEGVVARDKWFI